MQCEVFGGAVVALLGMFSYVTALIDQALTIIFQVFLFDQEK